MGILVEILCKERTRFRPCLPGISGFVMSDIL